MNKSKFKFNEIAYCANRGVKNYNKLIDNGELLYWHFEESQYEKSQINYNFWRIKESKYSDNAIIPLNKVAGTSHPNYHSKMWIEVLGCLKRFDNRDWDISTFMFKYKSGGIYFSKYGDKYFVNGGNNRVTVAKFLGIKELEAPVTEYFFDEPLFNLYKNYCDSNLKFELLSYSRDSSWLLKFNNLNVYLSDYDLAKKFYSYFKTLKIDCMSLIRIKTNLFFNKRRKEFNTFHLKNEFDFKLVHNEIINHISSLKEPL